MFFDQLKKICSERGTSPTAVVKSVGLSSGKVTAWKNGSIPKMNIIQLLADRLEVPVAYFFGSDIPQPLPEDEDELLSIYRRLGKSGQRQLIGKAYELMDGQTAPKSGNEVSPPDIDLVSTVLDRGIKK